MSSAPPGTQDMTQLTGEMYRQWEKAMTTWWDQVVENPGFLKGMSENLNRMAEIRSGYEDQVDQSLERMHLPTRKDLVRLARINTLLEERLLAQEDTILALQDRLVGLEREVVQARVEAAEARLESRETLSAVLEKLDRLADGAGAAAGRGRRKE